MDIVFALLSSIFASLTAILIKIGLSDVNSNLAAAIRTIIILIMSWIIVFYTNSVNSIDTIEAIKNLNTKTIIFIVLSGIATGLSWLFYFKALQIGNVNKVIVIDFYHNISGNIFKRGFEYKNHYRCAFYSGRYIDNKSSVMKNSTV